MSEQTLTWDGNMHPAIEFWMGDAFQSWAPTARELDFMTAEGVVTAREGDRITKSADGAFRIEEAAVAQKRSEDVGDRELLAIARARDARDSGARHDLDDVTAALTRMDEIAAMSDEEIMSLPQFVQLAEFLHGRGYVNADMAAFDLIRDGWWRA